MGRLRHGAPTCLLTCTLLVLAASCSRSKRPVAAPTTAVRPNPYGDLAASETGEEPGSGEASDKPPTDTRGAAAPLPPKDERRRAEGLKALDEGRFADARRIFAELVQRHPGNVSVVALHDAAGAAVERQRAGAAAILDNLQPTVLPPPPFAPTIRAPAPVPTQAAKPKLVQRSQRRNKITDDDAWFRDNALELPVWTLPDPRRGIDGNLPPEVPTRYGKAELRRAIRHPDHAILLYSAGLDGNTLLVVLDAKGKPRAAFDFGAWRYAPAGPASERRFTDQQPGWAEVDDDVLYVSTFHRTYAKSSGNKNAYISAIALDDGSLLWQSRSLVCNSRNFLLRDGWIIAGYGFTAEPDFLYVLDQKNGKVVAKHRLKSGPSYILEKQGALYVRTYDTDYVFDVK